MKTTKTIKKITLGVLSVLTVGLIATAGAVSAYQGNPDNEGPNFDADLHDLKIEAFDSYDFEVWKDLMLESGSQGRVLELVNEDNFNTFVDAHNAALAGDMDLSNELRSSIGLNNGVGPKDGSGFGNGMGEGKGQGMKNSQRMSGSRQGKNSADFVDADGDGVCDNTGLELNSGMGQGKGRR